MTEIDPAVLQRGEKQIPRGLKAARDSKN